MADQNTANNPVQLGGEITLLNKNEGTSAVRSSWIARVAFVTSILGAFMAGINFFNASLSSINAPERVVRKFSESNIHAPIVEAFITKTVSQFKAMAIARSYTYLPEGHQAASDGTGINVSIELNGKPCNSQSPIRTGYRITDRQISEAKLPYANSGNTLVEAVAICAIDRLPAGKHDLVVRSQFLGSCVNEDKNNMIQCQQHSLSGYIAYQGERQTLVTE